MDRLKQQQNRGYVIAGGAALIAFIAFFLPYVSVSYLGFGASVSGASVGSWLWFEFLGVLVAIAVAAVLLFRNKAFGLSNMPVDNQIKYGRYALIGAGALALLIHLLFLLSYQSNIGGILAGTTTGLSVGLGIGYWLFMIAAIAMIVGAVLALRQPIAAYTASQSPYGQPYPGQPTQYPPYQQPYPTTDQQQYPPYQSAPQQYPPQPQQPYQQQYPPQPQQPYQQQYPGQPQQYPPTEMQQPPQQYPQ